MPDASATTSIRPAPLEGIPKGAAQPAPLQVLVTAAEAYPAFERLVLDARDEVVMGFRIFDPRTRLRSAEGRAVGETWADLLADALRRGVRITLYLSDFDPLVATDLHAGTWRSIRILCGARELAGPGAAPLTLRPMLHPARIGLLQRLLFAPAMLLRMKRLEDRLAGFAGGESARPPEGEKARSKVERSHLPGVHALKRHRGLVPAFPASHHQKLAVVDGRHLYIGGLDLDERRYDTPLHNTAAQQSWHDVQVLLDDPAKAQAAIAHLHGFGGAVAGHTDAPAAPGLIRTLSADRGAGNLWHGTPRPILSEIADAHHTQIAASPRMIYLETQFFRDRSIARQLATRARAVPDLRLILVLPGAPNSVAFRNHPGLDGRFGDHLQAHCLRRIRRAFKDRMLVASPVQPRSPDQRDKDTDRATLHGAPLIYLHAKVSVFDDRAAIVSSANLNGRSMRWDSETGVLFETPHEVARLRDHVMGHWTGARPSDMDHGQLFNAWSNHIRHNANTPSADRSGFLVPYDAKAASETALPLPGIPEEMV